MTFPRRHTAVQSDLPVYQAVAARRMQWDALLWQVPALSLTAQAFLLTIAFSSTASQLARLLTSGLGVVTALLSLQLFIRQRQAELADAKWLEKYEQKHFTVVAHGKAWQKERNETEVRGCLGWLARFPAFCVWKIALILFGIVALAAFILTLSDVRILR